MALHLSLSCPEVLVQCAKCHKDVRRGLLNTHLQENCGKSDESGDDEHKITLPGILEVGLEVDILRRYRSAQFPTLEGLKWNNEWHRARVVEIGPRDVLFRCIFWQEELEQCEVIPKDEIDKRVVARGTVTQYGPIPGFTMMRDSGSGGWKTSVSLDILSFRDWMVTFDDGSTLNWNSGWNSVYAKNAEELRWNKIGWHSAAEFPLGMCFTADTYKGRVVVQLASHTSSTALLKLIRDARDLAVTSEDAPTMSIPHDKLMSVVRPLNSSICWITMWPWLCFTCKTTTCHLHH